MLSVVIAAYNEEPVIANNLRRVADELSTRSSVEWEIICVDDGSTDKTGKLMDEFASGNAGVRILHHRRNFGQGRALRTAFDQCRGDVIVTLDADLSYAPDYIYRLTDALFQNNAEIALASPYTKGGTVRNVPFHRRFLSRYGNLYLARMSHYSISTSTCVVRAYRREVLDAINLTSDGMELQLEVLMKAAMMGFRVCEIPACLEWTEGKAAGANLRRASKMRILQMIRLYLLMGWLNRPAYIFIPFSLLLIGMGSYLAINSVLLFFKLLSSSMDKGIILAISSSLKGVVASYYYGIVFSGLFLLFGLLTFAFSLILIQNKFYFEELYLLGQNPRNKNGNTWSSNISARENNEGRISRE